MEGLLAAIALRLLDANHLSRCLGFHAEEMQIEIIDFLETLAALDVIWLSTLLDMARNLIIQ